MSVNIKKTISIKLTSSGSDTNNFDIFEVLPGPSDNLIATGVSRSSLVTGATFGISTSATGYIIESTGACNTMITQMFPTTTTTTTTTLSYYSWLVQLGINNTLNCSSTPSLTYMCLTGNSYTTTVYTRYDTLSVGTTVYKDTSLTLEVYNLGYRTIRSTLAFDPLSGGIDYDYVYFIDTNSRITNAPPPVKCCGCGTLSPC